MVKFPSSFPKVPQESFFLRGPSGLLEVASTWPEAESIRAVIIICHPHPLQGGAMGNKVVTTIMRAANRENIASIRFNFRGVGKSEGNYGHVEGELEDLRYILDWVLTVLPKSPIFLAGFSFGSYIAARIANEQQLESLLISIAPPVNHFDFATLTEIFSPWWIIQGDQDEVVPYEQVLSWVNSQPCPPNLMVFEEAGHFFHGRLIELQEKIQFIFKKII